MHDLTSTFEGGPKYSDKEILRSSSSFIIRSKDKIEELDFDAVKVCAFPLSRFNLKLEDFSELPVNKLGLKTIAKYWVNELMVTANGFLVFYSHGIPSLRGLPSVIAPISGPVILENGNVCVPKFSLYKNQEYSALAMVGINASFNVKCEETFTLATELEPKTFSEYYSEVGIGFCNNFNPHYNSSKFLFAYPIVRLEDMERYNELVGDSNNQWVELGDNF